MLRLVVEDAAEVVAVRERPRPAAAGRRRRNRPGRCTAAGSRARSPGRAGASSPSSGSRCRPSRWRRWRRSCIRGRSTRPMPVMMPADGTSPSYMPWAASADSSRNGVPGSSSPSTRSRGSSLPRDGCRARGLAALPPLHRAPSSLARAGRRPARRHRLRRCAANSARIADRDVDARACGHADRDRAQPRLVEQFAADQHPADFAGAGADLVELGVAQKRPAGYSLM